MKVIITGIAGFLGSNYAHYLLENVNGIEIYGIDDFSGGYIENVPVNVHCLKCDLTDSKDQKKIKKQIFEKVKIDYIYSFACIACEGFSPFIRQFTYKNNVIANAFLINCAIQYKIKRFIFTSSMAVYGDQKPPFKESQIPEPVDPYGIAKYCCEMDLKAAHLQHGLEYVIIRPHNIYGERQNIYDVYRNVLGIWMYQCLNNMSITIYGDGKQTRAFSYIGNILPCLLNAAVSEKAKNQIINVGGTKVYSINDAFHIFEKIVGKRLHKIHLEPRYEVKHAHSTFEKSVKLLNYKETINFETGLKKMWEWCKNQTNHARDQKFMECELNVGLYSYWSK